MSEVGQAPQATSRDILAAVAQLPGDPVGSDTFSRYLWQAKQAVRQWLTCLSSANGPTCVICEHLEDTILVYPTNLRFVQLKTRERGSWSANGMCDEGLDSLAKSYSVALETELHKSATFELWLEGPISNAPGTSTFVSDPTLASATIRNKLLGKNAEEHWIDDFLSRVIIRAYQPPQRHIDAIAVREIACLWPSLSKPELDHIYIQLLQAATAAQAAQSRTAMVHPNIAAALKKVTDDEELDHELATALAPIREQILSREALTALAPPLPGEQADAILARIGQGSSTSLMELKMTLAGARPDTIQQAQTLRARMETKRQLFLANRASSESILERLAERVLLVAEATARRVQLSAVTNPVAVARPAEVIAMELLSQPANLGSLDHDSIFERDGLAVYGFLGHLSDLCRYPWRAA